jgi:ribosomal protein L12E/L44/L45/RPP1/RPP2
LATSPEVLANITAEEATKVFEALNVEDLSDAQIEQLVAAVQDAPQEVREALNEFTRSPSTSHLEALYP